MPNVIQKLIQTERHARRNLFWSLASQKRRALDLGRKAFADQVGCAEVTLRRIEAGTLKPCKELASILIEKLRIPDDERPQLISFASSLANPHSEQEVFHPLASITNLPAP
jgi:ribosome-binding protein aMBF1 (putative translation factor)